MSKAAAADPKPAITVTLKAPPPGFDKSEIVFREPTGEDIELYGMPFRLRESETPARVANPEAEAQRDPDIVFDTKAMTAMIAVLGDVPILFVRRLKPKDWLACAHRVVLLFIL